MKPLKFFPVIKRKLVKVIFIIFLALSPSFLTLSNPIIPPPVVFEIYFGPLTWEIEIMNNEYFSFIENFDDLWLVGKFDTARFEPGHSFLPGVIEIATQFDMLTPMTIQQSGDYVKLCYISGNYSEELGGLAWGSFSSEVTAPVGEQSIALQMFNLYNEWSSWKAKEQPHTINSNPGQVIKRTSFSGYVWDQNDEPIPNLCLDYCYGDYYYGSNPTVPLIYTNSDGYFHTDNMYSRKHYICFRIGDFYGPSIGDTNVYLEIDSANYFEFKLDTLLTGISENKPVIPGYSIYNIPNPSSTQTTFIIESNNPKPYQKGIIKVYSEAGFIVDILPVEILENKQEINYNFDDKSLPPGLYIYNLEIRNRKVASGKMIISR